MLNTGRALLAASALLLAATSCNGSNSNPVPPNPPGTQCSVGTDVALWRPTNNSIGNPTNLGFVTIVVNTNTDLLGTNWNVVLIDQSGRQLKEGNLSLTHDSGGPFPSDYFYNASLGTLTPGNFYTVYINQTNSQCIPLPIGQFGT
jgi:hypothetical protein